MDDAWAEASSTSSLRPVSKRYRNHPSVEPGSRARLPAAMAWSAPPLQGRVLPDICFCCGSLSESRSRRGQADCDGTSLSTRFPPWRRQAAARFGGDARLPVGLPQGLDLTKLSAFWHHAIAEFAMCRHDVATLTRLVRLERGAALRLEAIDGPRSWSAGKERPIDVSEALTGDRNSGASLIIRKAGRRLGHILMRFRLVEGLNATPLGGFKHVHSHAGALPSLDRSRARRSNR
jgi:hypothetical protein